MERAVARVSKAEATEVERRAHGDQAKRFTALPKRTGGVFHGRGPHRSLVRGTRNRSATNNIEPDNRPAVLGERKCKSASLEKAGWMSRPSGIAQREGEVQLRKSSLEFWPGIEARITRFWRQQPEGQISGRNRPPARVIPTAQGLAKTRPGWRSGSGDRDPPPAPR